MSFDGIRNKNKSANAASTKAKIPAIRLTVGKRAAPALVSKAATTVAKNIKSAQKPQRIKIKYHSVLTRIDKKQIATIVLTFIITFALSLASSQGLAQINSRQQVGSEATTTDVLPRQGELTVISFPQQMAFENNVQNKPEEITLPKEKITLPDPLKKRKEFLQKYLSAKGSVLAEHVDALSEQTQWKLIIGISRAESSFCKKHAVHNCWGIGGAWNLKNYQNYDQAIADVNRILEQHYIQAGLNSPKKMMTKWVGHANEDWLSAVQQELDALKDAP